LKWPRNAKTPRQWKKQLQVTQSTTAWTWRTSRPCPTTRSWYSPSPPPAIPSVLGIQPIPNLKERIHALLDHYRNETMDIEDVEFEPADLEEDKLFPEINEQQEQE